MDSRDTQPLIVIVGPTASGKTAAAIELAKKINGEIICADSRTVYKKMDVGTAKPTPEEQKEVKHHLLDVVDPNQTFTAANFQKLAAEKIAEIRARNKVPIMVGGTGLYIDSVIFDYKFGAQVPKKMREKFEHLTTEELWNYCLKNSIELPENKHNRRYIIRAIEQKGINKHKRNTIIEDCFVVGISTNKNVLLKRITQRAEQMFSENLMQETQRLVNLYGFDHEAMTASVYSLSHQINTGEISREEALKKFITLDWRLAKRQLTWFKRNKAIYWCKRDQVVAVVCAFIGSRQN